MDYANTNEDFCQVCGDSWDEHDFGVPYPNCPKDPLPGKSWEHQKNTAEFDKEVKTMVFQNFWETQDPVFINEIGAKWYVDMSVTKYCLVENIHGVSLKNILAYVVVLPTGEADRVLVDVDKNEVIFSTKELAIIGSEIDKLKLLKSYNKKHET